MKIKLPLTIIVALFLCLMSMTVVLATPMTANVDDANVSEATFVLTSDSYDEDYDDDAPNYFLAIVFGVVGGIIIAFVVTGSMKAKMNTARKKREAADYVRSGSFMLAQSYDRFLYENTTKTAKQNKK